MIDSLDSDQMRQHLFQMLRIRRIEEAIATRYSEQQMRCPTHLCIGEEAIAVGVSSQLHDQDKVFSNHRAHGHYLAKGGGLAKLIAELYGKQDGCCGGRGGSMHLTDLDVGFIASTPIVGGTVPVAAGMAWAMQQQKKSQVTVVYFGDGCFEEGVMHETLNFAALKKLPLIFVCENNQYAVMTGLNERQPSREIYEVAKAHGIASFSADGNDVEQVAKLSEQAITNARRGERAQFLEFSTHRWPEHCGPNDDDDLGYRKPGELESWRSKCPIERQKQRCLSEKKMSQQDYLQMEQDIAVEIEQAFEFSLASSKPGATQLGQHIYA
jgi:pyruvate dehydrogenase E1 component alpha subunit